MVSSGRVRARAKVCGEKRKSKQRYVKVVYVLHLNTSYKHHPSRPKQLSSLRPTVFMRPHRPSVSSLRFCFLRTDDVGARELSLLLRSQLFLPLRLCGWFVNSRLGIRGESAENVV